MFKPLFCILFTSVLAVCTRSDVALGVALDSSHPEALMSAIMHAYRSGSGQIVIPHGVYKLPEPRGGFYLSFKEMKNFRIVGKGVTLLRTDPTKGGILFDHCSNVTLEGFTLRCDPLPYTQGRVIAVDPAGGYIDLQLCQGFPSLGIIGEFAPSGFGDLFNPKTRRIVGGTPDVGYDRVNSLGSGRYRLFSNGHVSATWRGDIMAIRGIWHPDVQLLGCNRMVIKSVTVEAGTGFCFCEGGGDGRNQYIDDDVTYPPKPLGANVRPMLSADADGFHSGFYPIGVRHGPTLIGCRFEGMDDDGIAIHGAYLRVQNIHGKRIVIQSDDGEFVRQGDTLKFYNPKGGYLGEARVARIAIAKSYKPRRQSKFTPYGHASQFYRAYLSQSVPDAVFADYISDVDRDGSGFTIRNCTVKNNRARGMLIKADNGIIEDNTVDGSSMEGIVVAPELNWNEAGCSCNLLIEGNTIENVGDANCGPAYMAGAISIVAAPQVGNFCVGSIGHNGIVIVNNRLVDNSGLNLLLVDVGNGLVADNLFSHSMYKSHGGSIFCRSTLIWIQDSRNILLAGNSLVNPGHALKRSLGIGPGTSMVVGITNGVKTEPLAR